MEFKHKSVLLDETVGGLNIKPDGIYVDGTLGGTRTCHWYGNFLQGGDWYRSRPGCDNCCE